MSMAPAKKLELWREDQAGNLVFSGEDVAEARKRLDLTLPEAAEELGVAAQTVWRWEHNKTEPLGNQIPGLTRFIAKANRVKQ